MRLLDTPRGQALMAEITAAYAALAEEREEVVTLRARAKERAEAALADDDLLEYTRLCAVARLLGALETGGVAGLLEQAEGELGA